MAAPEYFFQCLRKWQINSAIFNQILKTKQNNDRRTICREEYSNN